MLLPAPVETDLLHTGDQSQDRLLLLLAWPTHPLCLAEEVQEDLPVEEVQAIHHQKDQVAATNSKDSGIHRLVLPSWEPLVELCLKVLFLVPVAVEQSQFLVAHLQVPAVCSAMAVPWVPGMEEIPQEETQEVDQKEQVAFVETLPAFVLLDLWGCSVEESNE